MKRLFLRPVALLVFMIVEVMAVCAFSRPVFSAGPISLARAATAPPSASGAAQFLGFDKTSGRPSLLSLKLQGLEPGLYRVALVGPAGDRLRGLGAVSLTDPTAAPDRTTSENFNQRTSSYQATSLEMRTQLPLPAEVDLAQVAKVIITDSLGNTVLTGKIAR